MTSTAAKEPILKLTVSGAMRAGLHALVKSLSKDIASSNLSINAVMPGYTDTERLKKFGVSYEDLKKQIPAQRLGSPEELANLVAFLASDCARYINGQAIAVDGGRLEGI